MGLRASSESGEEEKWLDERKVKGMKGETGFWEGLKIGKVGFWENEDEEKRWRFRSEEVRVRVNLSLREIMAAIRRE